jgi:release factor glutamine methyltransferase
MNKQWKVVELINATRTFFEKKGIADTARLDAELLLAEVLGCRRIDLYVRFDETVAEPALSNFRDLVRERGRRRPVRQLLGWCEFMSHRLELTPDVIVPRPETECVVRTAVDCIPEGTATVADVGTGSGNIAVSIALEKPGAAVYATDRSAAAIEVARRNAQQHGVADRVTFLAGDLCEPLLDNGLAGRLDCLASNPPYVAEQEWEQVMPEVRCEPKEALVSAENGMAHTRRLLAGAPQILRPGGSLVVELGPATAGPAAAEAEANDAYESIETRPDLNGRERVLIAVLRGN